MNVKTVLAAGALGVALIGTGGVAMAATGTPTPAPSPSTTQPAPGTQPGSGFGPGSGHGRMGGGYGDPAACPNYNSPQMQAWRDGREARQQQMRDQYGDNWTPPRDGTGPFHNQSPRANATPAPSGTAS